MIGKDEVEAYRRDGFVVVSRVLDAAEVAGLQAATDAMVEASRHVAEHDDVYDLDTGHSAVEPRVRRIKAAHLHHPSYAHVARHPAILAVLRMLVAPAIRFDTGKLNLKSAGYGAAVEWHQDWAFYPHTNDDLCAVGIMIDDCALVNGPLLCVPGSHRGPVFDHHSDGRFCGAIDPATPGLGTERAVPLTGPAGSITVHHCRTLHASAPNRSDKQRRLLLFQYRAADAWPLLGSAQVDFAAWQGLMLCGEDAPLTPRLADVPVRMPLPPAAHQGSIYENQRGLARTYFGDDKAA